jgi:RNA polymerase sigma-70 factor (ECF subfamily)
MSEKELSRPELENAMAALRPRLHRYCARMTGSVFDGEDVLQESLAKALQAFDQGAQGQNIEAWLVRIAHNAAIDFLRRQAQRRTIFAGQLADEAADATPTAEDRQLAMTQLRAFLALPTVPRSCVILMDVLGYSLSDLTAMLHLTLPAVKAALHRGRARLREAAAALEAPVSAPLGAARRALFERYVDRFNARDFDAIRDLLAEEVWLDMVARTRMKGPAEISAVYLRNYGKAQDWRFALGVADGRPVLVGQEPGDPGSRIAYFVELDWVDERVSRIRDFRYARYVTDGAEIALLD